MTRPICKNNWLETTIIVYFNSRNFDILIRLISKKNLTIESKHLEYSLKRISLFKIVLNIIEKVTKSYVNRNSDKTN